jgi:hypothetical protein
MRKLIQLLERDDQDNINGPQYATREQVKHLAAELAKQLPYRFDVESKPAVSPVVYIRIFGADIEELKSYFGQWGLEPLQTTPEQNILSGKYEKLSYLAGNTVYTLVIASVVDKKTKTAPAKTTVEPTGAVVVVKKEFTPTVMGLGGRVFHRDQLVKSTIEAVKQQAKDRPALMSILLELIEVASGNKSALSPENNANLNAAARKQLSQDFGEILAPILLADNKEVIEFPAEGNFPLIDVSVGANRYSIKSLTGSGTSFSSIVGLLDSFEKTIASDKDQLALFNLIKQYHPTAGGKNVDKIIRAALHARIAEAQEAQNVFGKFGDYPGMLSQIVAKGYGQDTSDKGYTQFLQALLPVSTAGLWDMPVGMPADAGKYLKNVTGLTSSQAKTAGYPSYRANPAKAMADILTYVLGVGTLNYITRGEKAKEYQAMMTKIVSQSPAWLGKIDITRDGQLSITTKPFSELNFGFQYHAPSHIPGNNLPGFMVIMDKPEKKKPVKEIADRLRERRDATEQRQRRD